MREPPQGIDFFHLTTQDNPVSHGAVEDFCKLPVVIEAVPFLIDRIVDVLGADIERDD